MCLESDRRSQDVEDIEEVEDPAEAEPTDTTAAAPLPDEPPMESAA